MVMVIKHFLQLIMLFFDLILSSATQVKIISDCLKKYMFQNCMSVEALYSIFKTTTEHLYA
ncbi:hypothetical protein CIK86_15385 [Pseudoalteromonas sp. JB197]|uniref:Membrane protein n=1 Tax=Pseudoalteromonas translucida (strain TAC 125) TaxID=326442 RepID=Q3IBT2_PSET1|nr:hypothetical protein CIK86_15385 [Pseudoalteromonas sp. JB197]CAI89322.1 putative membrane protein [Pseudoalteromonas translucida]